MCGWMGGSKKNQRENDWAQARKMKICYTNISPKLVFSTTKVLFLRTSSNKLTGDTERGVKRKQVIIEQQVV